MFHNAMGQVINNNNDTKLIKHDVYFLSYVPHDEAPYLSMNYLVITITLPNRPPDTSYLSLSLFQDSSVPVQGQQYPGAQPTYLKFHGGREGY